MANILANLIRSVKSTFAGKKADTFDDISIVETYETDSNTIENIASYYKMVTKISAIFKSLSEISNTLIAQNYVIQDENSEKEIENIPFELKGLLENPSENYTYAEFISLIIQDLYVAGNIYGYIQKGLDKKIQIRRLDPRNIEHYKNEWHYTTSDGQFFILDEKFLVHVKLAPDPNNVKFGKGIIASNITLFSNILDVLQFRENFYKKGCIPTGVFSVESSGAVIDTKLRAEIREKYQGVENAGEPLILTGNVKYQAMQIDPSTMKISEELVMLYKEVMAIFGMPRFLMELGLRDTGQKYNNHAKQAEHWIKNTIIPVAKKIEGFFNEIVIRYKLNYRFKYNINAEVYSAETIQQMTDAGIITPNEHLKLQNMQESEDEDMDKRYMPAGKRLMSDIAAGISESPELPSSPPPGVPGIAPPAAPPLPAGGTSNPGDEDKKKKKKKSEEEEDAGIAGARPIPNGKQRTYSWRDNIYLAKPAMPHGIWSETELADKLNIKRIVQDFVNLNKKTRDKKSKEQTKKFLDYLANQYLSVFKAMKKHEKELEKLTNPEKAEEDVERYIGQIYKVTDEAAKIVEIAMPLFQSVGTSTYSNTENILTVNIPFSMADPGVAAKVNLLREKTVLVAEGTRNQIEEVVKRGVENNSTAAEVAKDMWRHFVDEDKKLPDEFIISNVTGKRLNDRAVTIARNEVNRANRLFSTESMKSSGVVKSIQLVGFPDADGTCTPYFNQFYPFEMADELSSIHVNCRCTVVPGEISVEGE